MSSILHVACRIQAAVKAYCSVKEHADRELWEAQFFEERVRTFFRRFMDLISILN
jgi:hypothetical protein